MEKVRIVTEFYTLDIHSTEDASCDRDCAIAVARAIIFTHEECSYVRSLSIEVYVDDVFNKALSQELTDIAYEKED